MRILKASPVTWGWGFEVPFGVCWAFSWVRVKTFLLVWASKMNQVPEPNFAVSALNRKMSMQVSSAAELSQCPPIYKGKTGIHVKVFFPHF